MGNGSNSYDYERCIDSNYDEGDGKSSDYYDDSDDNGDDGGADAADDGDDDAEGADAADEDR